MKSKLHRSILALLSCLVVSCVNPYLAQMDALDADYRAGLISREEYYRRSESLSARSDAWAAQNSANVALGAAAIGAAATVGGAYIQAEATEDVAHAINNKNSHGHSSHGKKSGGSKPQSKGKSKPKQQPQAQPQPSGNRPPPGGGGGTPPKRPPPQ